ncbi:hypothetical protein CYMTET_23183, partial [Cymbomonas tetramitiformis]
MGAGNKLVVLLLPFIVCCSFTRGEDGTPMAPEGSECTSDLADLYEDSDVDDTAGKPEVVPVEHDKNSLHDKRKINYLWNPVDSMAGHAGSVRALAEFKGVLHSGDETGVLGVWSAKIGNGRYYWSRRVGLKGHTGAIRALAANEDTLFSASEDKTIRLWRDDATVAVLLGHRAEVTSLALDRTRGLLYSGSEDKTIRVWNDGHHLDTFFGHTGGILALVYAEGALYSGGWDSTIRVWRDSEHEFTLKGHRGAVTALAYDSANGILYSGADDKSIKLWR